VISVSSDDLEGEIDLAIRNLIAYLEADWGSLILFDNHSAKEPAVVSGAICGTPLPSDIVSENYPYFRDKIKRGEAIILGKIPDDVAQDAAKEKEFLLQEGYKSILIIPLRAGIDSWGWIAFGSIQGRREWSIEMVRRLKVAGEILANVIGRKKAEETLRLSESQKETILNASVDRIRYVDKDMRIIWTNKASALGAGLSAEELVGRHCYEVNHGTQSPCAGCPTLRSMKTGQVERQIMRYPQGLTAEGGEYGDNYCVPLRNEKGEIDRFVQVYRDITYQKHAEEKIYNLSQELIRAQERERQMISRELHDTVAQDLCSLKVACETLFDNQVHVSEILKGKVLEIANNLQRTIQAVRDLSYNLRPSGLEELGLMEVLSRYCEEFAEKSKIPVQFHSLGVESAKWDFDTDINVYRIIQEGLNNILKHSRATKAKISFVGAFPHFILRIEDNGKGFELQPKQPGQDNPKRMGLQSIRERVSLLKGEMTIHTGPNQGTKIVIKAPYPENGNG
jgi:PAS domain S-box-containing protein